MSPYKSDELPSCDEQRRIERIRELNDSFRSTFVDGQVMMTCGVAALAEDVQRQVLLAVQTFDSFTADNDPYGEHDFGSFDLDGAKFFWKIEYFDRDLMYGSEDPADPEKTIRVLTLMLAEEY